MQIRDDETLIDQIERERLLLNALERQHIQTDALLRAYRVATWCSFVVGLCLTISTLCLIAVLIAR